MMLLGLLDADELAATYEEASTHAAELARPFPGVPTALRALADARCRLGVVTSKPRDRALPLLAQLGVRLETVRTPEDGRGKPHPDLLQTALAELGGAPSDAVYVGGTAVDQEAAARAGLAYVHAGWGYGHPRAPLPPVLAESVGLVWLAGDPEPEGSR
jgi:HAD superfamily hydrolase (TIGR01509 family)